MGQALADVVALWFDELRLPADALLGAQEGLGFQQLSDRLVEERLLTGIVAVEMMDRAIAHTLEYSASEPPSDGPFSISRTVGSR
jgi:acyl-CoA dehydrogenase